jgi:hypothetical protein
LPSVKFRAQAIQKFKIKNRMKSRNSLPSHVTTIIHKPQLPKTWPCADRRTRLRRSALLRLAFIVNSLADSPSEQELPLPDVHAAAQEGRLLELLAQYAGRRPDFSFLQSPVSSFDELNSALRLSSTVLQGREFLKAGVYRNGYCLALALVLYAIRENSPQIWPPACRAVLPRRSQTKAGAGLIGDHDSLGEQPM